MRFSTLLLALVTSVSGRFLASPKGYADVFFSADPLETSLESSYQSVLSGLKNSVNRDYESLRSASQTSFLQLLPKRTPTINVYVEPAKGVPVDGDRLRSDLLAFVHAKLLSFQDELKH